MTGPPTPFTSGGMTGCPRAQESDDFICVDPLECHIAYGSTHRRMPVFRIRDSQSSRDNGVYP